jgi:hypothetical protein
VGEFHSSNDAVPGVAPQLEPLPVAQTLEVDGEVFELRPDGFGGTQYDWISGPNENYGFAVSPAPDSPEQHEAGIRDFLSMIDPATGYIQED